MHSVEHTKTHGKAISCKLQVSGSCFNLEPETCFFEAGSIAQPCTDVSLRLIGLKKDCGLKVKGRTARCFFGKVAHASRGALSCA